MNATDRQRIEEIARHRKECPWKIGAILHAYHIQQRHEDYCEACELLGLDLAEGNVLRKVYETFHGLFDAMPELTALPYTCFRLVRTLDARESRRILWAAAKHDGSQTKFVQQAAKAARGTPTDWDAPKLRIEFEKARERIENNVNGHHETLKALVETWLEDLN